MASWIAIRQSHINKILNTLIGVQKEGKEIDEKEFAFLISEEFNCTERKAREYLKIAQLKLAKINNAEQELHQGETEGIQDLQTA